jgi:hypothetical protein
MNDDLLTADLPLEECAAETTAVATESKSNGGAVRVTEHADARLKERLGLPKSARQSAAQRAFDNGKRHREATGRLKRYLDRCWHMHKTANNVRLHAEHIWFFAGTSLVTTYETLKHLRGGI